MSTRPNAPDIKVICFGLGRTGTVSMRQALEILGFGPCYHMSVVYAGVEGHPGKDFPTWFEIGKGKRNPETFDELYQGFHSILDYPGIMYAKEIHAAYPNAKFILTTRDPVRWEFSMKRTILRVADVLAEMKPEQRVGLQSYVHEWLQEYMLPYHHGRAYTHTQEEFLIHNEHIKSIVPPENLLIMEVNEGWDPLVKFLGVPKPDVQFPHLNEISEFEETFINPIL